MRITPEQTRKLPGLLAEPDAAPLFFDLTQTTSSCGRCSPATGRWP